MEHRPSGSVSSESRRATSSIRDHVITRQTRRRLTGLSAAQVCRYLGLPVPPESVATECGPMDSVEETEGRESHGDADGDDDGDDEQRSSREDDYLDSIESTSQIDHNSCSASCCPWESEPDMDAEDDSAVGLPSPAETTFAVPNTHESKHGQPSHSGQHEQDHHFGLDGTPPAEASGGPAGSSAPSTLSSAVGGPISPLSLASPSVMDQGHDWEALPQLPPPEEAEETERYIFAHPPTPFARVNMYRFSPMPSFSTSYMSSVDYTGLPPLSPSSSMAPASMPPAPPYASSPAYSLNFYSRDLHAYSENYIRTMNLYACHNYEQEQHDETQARAAMQLMRLLGQGHWHGAWHRQ